MSAELASGGGYLSVRDVFLVSADVPPGFHTDANTQTDLCTFGLPCRAVVDLILWAQSLGVHVRYEPEANMRGWFGRKSQDEQFLFDPT